ILSDNEQIRLLNVDASRIDTKKLGLKLECAIGGGQLSAAIELVETGLSLNAKINMAAQKIAAAPLNKFLFLPDDTLSGEIERLAFDGAGTIDAPRTWNGTMSLQISSKIDIVNARIEAVLGVTGQSVGFPDGTVEKLSSTLRASKSVARTDTKRPWFADLRTAMEFDLAGIRYRDQIIDSVEGSLNGSDDILGLDRLTLRRNQNELNVRGHYKLPQEVGKAPSQPADLDIAFNAPEVGDFWVADSPSKLSGPLQMAGQIEWKQQTANGQVSISGSNLKMRDLVFREVNTQCSISNNIVYLNDCRASLNDSDFVNATGNLNLRRPYHYHGKVSASVANLSTLQPLLRTFGNQNELSGSVTLDWEGNGDTQISKSSGNLKFALEKGRYGNAQSLRANVDASYSPDGLDVPIIFFASGNSDFQAVAQAKGET